jgi:hypothetical protein
VADRHGTADRVGRGYPVGDRRGDARDPERVLLFLEGEAVEADPSEVFAEALVRRDRMGRERRIGLGGQDAAELGVAELGEERLAQRGRGGGEVSPDAALCA